MKHLVALFIVMISTAVAAVTGEREGGTAAQGDETYQIERLRSLGGRFNRGNSINDSGIVAGFTDVPDGTARHATVWFHGRQQILENPLGGPNSNVAWPVKNNGGLIVGIAQTDRLQPRGSKWSCRGFLPLPDSARYQCLGVVWENGRMTALDTLGGDNGFAAGANNLRQVVGWAENDVVDPGCEAGTQVLQFRAVLWDLNTNLTHELSPLTDDHAGAATAINDRGQVVGISGECDQAVGRLTAKHAVLWENGAPRRLDDLGGPAWNTPTAINQRGDMVAGFATLPGDNPNAPRLRAVVWTTRDGVCPKLPGTDICDLGMLDGHLTSQATGVNDRGQVVGISCPASGACSAFIWENGVMKDLNTLKANGFQDHLEHAMDINEVGRITGRSMNQATEVRTAILATPIGRPAEH